MSEVYVVVGHEFYASWVVRAFMQRSEAEGFASRLSARYEELRVPTAADRVDLDGTDTAPEWVQSNADQRALRQIVEEGLDPEAGGLEVTWHCVAVPLGAP